MGGEGSQSGWAVPAILVVWLVAVGLILTDLGGPETAGPGASPAGTGTATPEPTPVPLPTEVQVGASLDPDTDQVTEPQLRFEAESSVAISVWLGEPVGTESVAVSLARLESDGFHPVGDAQQVSVSPEARYVSAELPAEALLSQVGPGTYRIDVDRPEGEHIGSGVMQLEVTTPEDIEIFPEPRRADFAEGEHVGYRFDQNGEVVEQRPAVIRPAGARIGHRATYAGQPYLFVIEGIWERFYVPESERVQLAQG